MNFPFGGLGSFLLCSYFGIIRFHANLDYKNLIFFLWGLKLKSILGVTIVDQMSRLCSNHDVT